MIKNTSFSYIHFGLFGMKFMFYFVFLNSNNVFGLLVFLVILVMKV